MAKPTRVAVIGLSKAGWAPTAHLPYLKASPHYEIVALCNSSVESAQEAIKLYDLSDSVRAYGDPEGVAKDPEVDLVICSVRVDRHLPMLIPSLKAGKDVFVEWPLGKSAAEARQLLKLKNEGGVKRAIVGLQARQAPIIKKLKSLVDSGRIGKVLNSTWAGYAGNGGPELGERISYMGDKEVGGNLVSIHLGHSVDYVQAVLGYGFEKSNSVLANRRPFVKLVDGEGKVLDEKHRKTSDDTIFLQGALKSSGVPLSYTLRGGSPFPGTPGLEWRIYGEKAEIRVTAAGPLLQIGYPGMKVEVHDFDFKGEGNGVEEIKIEEDEWDGKSWGWAARNVARVYEGLREWDGKGEREGLCTWGDAADRHGFLEGLYKENGYVEGEKV